MGESTGLLDIGKLKSCSQSRNPQRRSSSMFHRLSKTKSNKIKRSTKEIISSITMILEIFRLSPKVMKTTLIKRKVTTRSLLIIKFTSRRKITTKLFTLKVLNLTMMTLLTIDRAVWKGKELESLRTSLCKPIVLSSLRARRPFEELCLLSTFSHLREDRKKGTSSWCIQTTRRCSSTFLSQIHLQAIGSQTRWLKTLRISTKTGQLVVGKCTQCPSLLTLNWTRQGEQVRKVHRGSTALMNLIKSLYKGLNKRASRGLAMDQFLPEAMVTFSTKLSKMTRSWEILWILMHLTIRSIKTGMEMELRQAWILTPFGVSIRSLLTMATWVEEMGKIRQEQWGWILTINQAAAITNFISQISSTLLWALRKTSPLCLSKWPNRRWWHQTKLNLLACPHKLNIWVIQLTFNPLSNQFPNPKAQCQIQCWTGRQKNLFK